MTHQNFAHLFFHGYERWDTDVLLRTLRGMHTPDGWHAEIRGDDICVWKNGENREQPPYMANAKAVHRAVADAKSGAKQLSLF